MPTAFSAQTTLRKWLVVAPSNESSAPSNESPTFHLHSVVCGKPFIRGWKIVYQHPKRKLPTTKQGQLPKMSQFCVFFGGWPFICLYSIGSLSITVIIIYFNVMRVTIIRENFLLRFDGNTCAVLCIIFWKATITSGDIFTLHHDNLSFRSWAKRLMYLV